MDFGDDLPCGGYEGQDKKIQKNLEQLSLQSQGIKQQKQCNTKACNQQCIASECCQINISENIKEQKGAAKRKVECKKCKLNQAVMIHKNQQICKQCLLKNIEYKTRLTLQNKIKVSSKSRVLICFSGGLNSICLVKILSNIKKRYQKSPLFGHLECIHVQQQSRLPENYVKIFEQATSIKLNLLPIQSIYKNENKGKTFEDVVKLFKMFKKNSNTIDLLTLFRNKIILNFAQQNQFDFVVTGKNGQSLASQIFKYFTKGIGGSSPQLCSSEASPFQYPLRQHLQKQLQYYFYNEKLSNLSMKAEDDDLSNIAYNEIDSYLDQFIAILQDRYSHTAPAIVRTGQKIKNNFVEEKGCKWCWLKHDREGVLCQKCLRLRESIKDEQIWGYMPEWTQL